MYSCGPWCAAAPGAPGPGFRYMRDCIRRGRRQRRQPLDNRHAQRDVGLQTGMSMSSSRLSTTRRWSVGKKFICAGIELKLLSARGLPLCPRKWAGSDHCTNPCALASIKKSPKAPQMLPVSLLPMCKGASPVVNTGYSALHPIANLRAESESDEKNIPHFAPELITSWANALAQANDAVTTDPPPCPLAR